MRKEKMMNEVTLELAETTEINIRQVMQNNEDAISSLSAFAQPVRPLKLVRPPKPVQTLITFEVDPRFIQEEIQTAKRRKAVRQLNWFELVALFGVTGLGFVKLGVLDLVSLWT